MKNMLPVCIFNGPLGSGKTTLIHALCTAGIDASRTLWLKTEYGKASVDEFLLRDTGMQMQSLSGGCICHILLSQLDGVLARIEHTSSIEQVFIETSGMSHPIPVVQTIERHANFRVAHVALIVDVLHAGETRYPKPMILPHSVSPSYSLIICNLYPRIASPQEEADVDQRLDPWFDGAYASIDKLYIPDEKDDPRGFAAEITKWLSSIKHDLHQVLIQSPVEMSQKCGSESEWLLSEDHESDMEALTLHLPGNTIVAKELIETRTPNLPAGVVRVKGALQTAPGIWEFFNWVRGRSTWTRLDLPADEQILLVLGDGIRPHKNSIQELLFADRVDE